MLWPGKHVIFAAMFGMAIGTTTSAQAVDKGEVPLEMKGGSFVAKIESTASTSQPHHWVLPLIKGKLVTAGEFHGVGGYFEIQVPDGREPIVPHSVYARVVTFNAPVTGDYIIVVSPAEEFTGGDPAMDVPYLLSLTVSGLPE